MRKSDLNRNKTYLYKHKLTCDHCNAIFGSNRIHTKFCSYKCKTQHYRKMKALAESETVMPGRKG